MSQGAENAVYSIVEQVRNVLREVEGVTVDETLVQTLVPRLYYGVNNSVKH